MQQGYSGGMPHNVSPHNGMDCLLDQQDRATGTWHWGWQGGGICNWMLATKSKYQIPGEVGRGCTRFAKLAWLQCSHFAAGEGLGHLAAPGLGGVHYLDSSGLTLSVATVS